MLIALRLVYGMLVRDLSTLAVGEEAFATVVAPNDDLRQQAVNYALGVCRAKPELARLLRLPKNAKPEDTPSRFGIYRPDFDRVVTFNGAVATRGGYGVRGRWHTDLALDECAFFRDSTAKVSDKDIYEAGVSRVLPGGQVILGSTPWAEAGLLFEFWRDNFGNPTTAIVAHAPTLLLNDSPATRPVVELETKRNPENAKREYGACFMKSGTIIFFEPDTVEAMFVEDAFTLSPKDLVSAGADFAFRSDSSGLVKTALRADGLHVYGVLECRPEDDKPLKPSVTVKRFADEIRGECKYVMADQHYRESIVEHLDASSLGFVPAPTTPADTYVRARMLLREGKVKVHAPNIDADTLERLKRQLRDVQGKPTPGGGMSIIHPKWAVGGHGDLAAAFVLGLWQLSGDEIPPPPLPDTEKARRERYERFQQEQQRPRSGARGGGAGISAKHMRVR